VKNPLVLGLMVVLVCVSTVTFLAYRSAQGYGEMHRMVIHTHQVLERLGSLEIQVREAESSARGYIASGEEEPRAQFMALKAEIQRSIRELKGLMSDNAAQQARIRSLEALVADGMRGLDRLVTLRMASDPGGAIAGLPAGRIMSEKPGEILDEMLREERNLLQLRTDASELSLGRTMTLFGVICAAAVILLIGLFVSARHSMIVRNRAEETMRQSARRFEDLYDHAPFGYCSVDPSGIVERMNATALGWLGYHREDVEGKLSLRGLIAPGSLDAFERDFQGIQAHRTPISGREHSVRRKGGTEFPVLLNARVEAGEGGKEGIRISFLDISDRKRIERELDQFFTNSLDLLGVADLAVGRFTRVNPAWESLLGWTPEEVCSRRWVELTHPDDVAATNREAGGLAEGKPVVSFTNRYRAKDGSYRWLSWKTPAPLPGSRVLYAVARDITEDRRKEEEIRRLNEDLARRIEDALASNRELEAFSYSVSHDLRAPLRAIDGFSRILVEDHAAVLGGEGLRLLNQVCASSRQMGQLIDDLLQYSRLGRKDLESSAVDMASLARDAVEESRKAQQGRPPEVGMGDLPGVRGDRVLLRQVWANLVGNAFKYSRSNPAAKVEIAGERRNGHAVFSVRDNGVGFDMQYAGKLFGVFQRLHSVREFEGTGVGLAIVHRIVQRHGGRVWAEGKPGEGAVFHFSIPAEA